MRRKLRLDVDELAVSSFDAGEADAAARGTVQANAPCTCLHSCACPSAIYYCGTLAYTAYSCDYTKNLSCVTT